MVTPVTSPVIEDFCFLPVVPRALRVALAFAVAAARASADRGLGDFFGAMASSARVVGALLNINATTSLTSFTVSPSWASARRAVAIAPRYAAFAGATATETLRMDEMSATT